MPTLTIPNIFAAPNPVSAQALEVNSLAVQTFHNGGTIAGGNFIPGTITSAALVTGVLTGAKFADKTLPGEVLKLLAVTNGKISSSAFGERHILWSGSWAYRPIRLDVAAGVHRPLVMARGTETITLIVGQYADTLVYPYSDLALDGAPAGQITDYTNVVFSCSTISASDWGSSNHFSLMAQDAGDGVNFKFLITRNFANYLSIIVAQITIIGW